MARAGFFARRHFKRGMFGPVIFMQVGFSGCRIPLFFFAVVFYGTQCLDLLSCTDLRQRGGCLGYCGAWWQSRIQEAVALPKRIRAMLRS
jgi:hypothetical protein